MENVRSYLCEFLSNVFHFLDNSKNTSSKFLNCPLASFNDTPTDFNAVSTLL